MVCGSSHSEAACLGEGGSISIRLVTSHIGVSKLPQWYPLEMHSTTCTRQRSDHVYKATVKLNTCQLCKL